MTHATDGLVNWDVLSLHFLDPGVVRRHDARVGFAVRNDGLPMGKQCHDAQP